MKRISEQIRELPSNVPAWRGPNSDYNEGWRQATETAAGLIETLEEVGVIERGNAVTCGYCECLIYSTSANPSEKELADEQAAFAAHDAKCEQNPLVKRIAELEALCLTSDAEVVMWQQRAQDEAQKLATLMQLKSSNDERLCTEIGVLMQHVETLQPQLAWTPVSDGLPTVDRETRTVLVACDGHGGALFLEPRYHEDGEWKWCSPEFPFGIRFADGCDWRFRRIELPEAK